MPTKKLKKIRKKRLMYQLKNCVLVVREGWHSL
jgi:hypothetical protein